MTRLRTARPALLLALLPAMLAAQPIDVRTQADAAAPVVQLRPEQTAALRCAVVFAAVERRQAGGEDSDLPRLDGRGREFFVRTMAKLMDDTGADRASLAALARTEAERLAAQEGARRAAFPGCLRLLEAAGL